jgi:hypothetical protein
MHQRQGPAVMNVTKPVFFCAANAANVAVILDMEFFSIG